MPSDRTGHVFWITGLSGTGKTTLAIEMYRLLRQRVPGVVRVDGDEFREMMGGDVGYDMRGRLVNALRIARVCRWLSSQELHVVCATVSMFREVHEWNRTHISRYVEVLLKTSTETLRRRDQKGLVSQAAQGMRDDVVGHGQPYDEPARAEHVIWNDGAIEELLREAEHLVTQYQERLA